MAKGRISKRSVDALRCKPKQDRAFLWDGTQAGFGVVAFPSGKKVFVYQWRKAGRTRRLALGDYGTLTPDKARSKAKKVSGAVEDNKDPIQARRDERVAGKTVSDVLDDHVTRHLEKNELRSVEAVKSVFKRLVKPKIGKLEIYKLRRSDIKKMLDGIEDEQGPVMADRTLAYVRKALNWYALGDDEFSSPIVRGMARTKPRERARQRTLDDDEIRDVWAAIEEMSAPYPGFVRSLLLTAQRRDEVAQMRWDETEEGRAGDIWIIPAERYKTKIENVVPITAAARAIIGQKPKVAQKPKAASKNEKAAPFVFSTTNGKRPFSSYSKAKRTLNEKIAELRKRAGRDPMPPWVLHDLRRTARSLMSRAGVESDIAERVLGHILQGVRGTYDRHAYEAEKRDALTRLASLVDRILKPDAANVTHLPVRKLAAAGS